MAETHRYEVNGHVFEADHVLSAAEAGSLQRALGGGAAPAPQPPMGLLSRLGRAVEGPAGLREAVTAPGLGRAVREQAPLLGQVGGGLAGAALAPATGGGSLAIPALLGFLGGVGGSAIQRGGAPTTGDVVTAGVGEALPMVPGAGRAGAGFLGERFAPAMMSRLGQAGRFGVPLGVGEASAGVNTRSAFESLFRNPFASRFLNRAGRAQSSALTDALTNITERWFGGELPLTKFGRQGATAIRKTVGRLSPGRAGKLERALTALPGAVPERAVTFPGRPVVNAATQLADDTLLAARLADAVAQKPRAAATVMRLVGGEQGMKDLGAAWLTRTLEGATVKDGLKKGLISPKRLLEPWDALGEKGQAAVFGNRAQHLRAFFEVARQARAAELVGTKTHIPRYFMYTMGGIVLGRGGPWSEKAVELLGVEAAIPWLTAHALANGPPGELTRLLAPAAPTLARALVQSGASEAGAAELPPGMPSTELPGPQQRPGDYRPAATARLSERAGSRRAAVDVARDRDYLERIDSDRARQFAAENPDAGREDYLRWLRKRGLDR